MIWVLMPFTCKHLTWCILQRNGVGRHHSNGQVNEVYKGRNLTQHIPILADWSSFVAAGDPSQQRSIIGQWHCSKQSSFVAAAYSLSVFYLCWVFFLMTKVLCVAAIILDLLIVTVWRFDLIVHDTDWVLIWCEETFSHMLILSASVKFSM